MHRSMAVLQLGTSRAIVQIAASVLLFAPVSFAVAPEHIPGTFINRHSENAGRIGPLRGFLPRALSNACPRAVVRSPAYA